MAAVETISVTITSEMMRAIRESIASGEYRSADEAVRAAVGAWQRQRRGNLDRTEPLQDRVQRSLDDPRPSLSADEAEAQLCRFMDAR